jgi:protein-L-isoaspartate(D-aspartate) O-methyltransferase
VSLEAIRRGYAESIRVVAALAQPALVEAFARVPREAFLGHGPWLIGDPLDRARKYRPTDDADPARVYHDVLIAIDPARELNNGMPSALARWIAALAIAPGETVVHVGCGTGYYTAILAELVGPGGRVIAYEVDPALAARATAALAGWPQVTVHAGDARAIPPADAVLINAGVTRPRDAWLDALAPGGRLVVPLTIHVPELPGGVGAMVRLDRGGAARLVSPVGIYDCAAARDPADEDELKQLLRPGGVTHLRVVERAPHERGDACLAHLPGFCLQRGL